MCCMKDVGSSMKINETWSMMVQRVEAFSEGVVAPFQERLVNKIRGLELPSNSGYRMREGCSLLQVGACVLV